MIVFTLVSLFELPPWWWFLAALGGLLWLMRRERRVWQANALAGALTVVIVGWAGADYIWSPYHKLAVYAINPRADDEGQPVKPRDIPALARTQGFRLAVNDDFFQTARNLSPLGVRMYPDNTNDLAHYELPYTIGRRYADVLVVGAGTGNDVAAALRHGARHVDAVEIDPAIARIGRIAHPEAPYDDPRVRVIVDDARSYFNKTHNKYDLIVIALLDSHRLFSGMSSVRLDSFVYTVESFREAGSLLKSNGFLCVQHGLGREFMRTRLYYMLAEAFQMPPGSIGPDSAPTFMDGPGLLGYKNRLRQAEAPTVVLASDDWPFFYMAGPQMPSEYRMALEAMALLALLCLLACSGGQWRNFNRYSFHFFFLGAAFLLIETVSVTRFALLFGSTWIVNSIVFAAILLVVLIANLCTSRVDRIHTAALYLLLAAAVFANLQFPLHRLLSTPLGPRLLAAMALMGAPILFAALIFARSFRETTTPELAFAANLLGSVVGGLTEYSSLVIGFRYQLAIAFIFYALSYLPLIGQSRKQVPTTV